MDILFVILSMIMLTAQGCIWKWYNQKHSKGAFDIFWFYGLCCLFVSIILLAYAGKINRPEMPTLIFGVLFGVFYVVTQNAYMKAMSIGSMAFTSLILNSSVFIQVVVGLFFWQEQVTIFQVMGFGLLILSMVLGMPKDENNHFQFKWFFLSLLAMVANAVCGLFQKMQQTELGGEQTIELIFIGFLTASVLEFLLFGLMKWRSKKKLPFSLKSSAPVIGLLAGAATAIGQIAFMSIVGKFPASTLFPLVSGTIILLSSLVSVIFFREKLTKKQWFGIGAGLAAVLFIGGIISV